MMYMKLSFLRQVPVEQEGSPDTEDHSGHLLPDPEVLRSAVNRYLGAGFNRGGCSP